MKVTRPDKNGLTKKQLKALPFLISARSEGEGCQQAKIARQTYYEWLKEPTFKAELNRLRNLLVEDAMQTLKGHTAKAIDTLISLLDNANPLLKRNVANDILQHVLKFKELQEIETRLHILENQFQEEQGEKR